MQSTELIIPFPSRNLQYSLVLYCMTDCALSISILVYERVIHKNA